MKQETLTKHWSTARLTFFSLLILSFLLLAAGCQGNGEKGRLLFQLSTASDPDAKLTDTDTPKASDLEEVAHLWVTVEKVQVKKCQGSWFDVPVDPAIFDLMTLADGGLSEAFASAALMPLGKYCETHLILTEQSTLQTTDGEVYPLEVPSTDSSGFKIKGEYKLQDDKLTVITVGLDPEKSLHRAGNSGKYVLNPVVFIGNVEYKPNVAVKIELSQPITLKTAMDNLPPELFVRGFKVQFEPGRTSNFLLAHPTQSVEAVKEDFGQARTKLHSGLRQMLSAGNSEMQGEGIERFRAAMQEEIDKIDALDSMPVDENTLILENVFVDGPTSAATSYANSLGGEIQ